MILVIPVFALIQATSDIQISGTALSIVMALVGSLVAAITYQYKSGQARLDKQYADLRADFQAQLERIEKLYQSRIEEYQARDDRQQEYLDRQAESVRELSEMVRTLLRENRDVRPSKDKP